nr:retrovirus-related Pol polyprotein from transposon TNT 1-94 [Tanacetum cinerariifolium]
LAKFKYHKEHLCPSCEQGKSKRASHPPKPVPNSRQRSHLLHMDLYGPMRIASINGKRYIFVIMDDYSRYTWVHFLRSKDEALAVIITFLKRITVLLHINGKRYILVIVDDYSRYSWVHFLRSKDEAPDVIITILKRITVLLQSPVIIIRTDNGTEFKNQVLKVYFDSVGISRQMSSVRTPKQNGVVERRNRTLVEAARTMLIFSRASLFLWAEAIATACFTQNRSIIYRRFNKTPYELINGRKPNISFLHVFGALCYPKNDHEDIEKLGAKSDIGFFIGYSADSCAYKIFNRRTKKIIETMNVSFDELSAMGFEQCSSKPGLQSMTSGQINSGLDLTYALSTKTKQQPTEDIGKLGAKGDIGFFIGYSADSCAYRVYNRRTKKIMETMNVSFDELSAMAFEQRTMYDDYIGGQPSATARTVPPAQEPQVRQSSTASTTIANTAHIPTNSSSLATNIPIASQDVDELNPNAMVDGNTNYIKVRIGILSKYFSLMKSRFEMSMMGEMMFFLGLQVNQSPCCIFINQSKYVLEILNKYGMESCDPVGTPMEIKDKLDLDQNGTPVNATKHHSMIGALMYLTSSRPDIVHATYLCARYQAKPTEKHLKEVKRIFRYLRGTVNTRLWYTKHSGFELTRFSDADYAGCKDTFKSTSGGAQLLGIAVEYQKDLLASPDVSALDKPHYQLENLSRRFIHESNPDDADTIFILYNGPYGTEVFTVMNGNPSRVNIKQLCGSEGNDKVIRYVAFGGNPKGGKISGKGKIRTGKLDFNDVYFVKELKFNLFSVSQMCDKKNNVLFIDTECVVLSFDFKMPDENHVLLRVPRENNMYNVDLKNVVPSGGIGPKWLFDIDTLTMSMNYQPVIAGNQPNNNALSKKILMHNIDDDVADVAFDVKENEDDVHELGILELNLKNFFNSTNRVNAVTAPVNVVGPNPSNSTNSFNTASPSVNAISPNFEIARKSLFVDPSKYPDDLDMPELEDIVYSDDEEDVGFENPDYPDKVYKVVKSLYGLHQAPRAWRSYKLGIDQLERRLAEYKEREVKYIETIRSLERDKEYNLRKINKLTNEVETLQEEKDVVDGKLAHLIKSSKDLKDIIESQRSENVKEGVGYNVVPPPAANLYHSPKKDLSWTGLPEFADDTVTDYSRPSPTVESTSAEGQNKHSTTAKNGESTNSILSKPAVKFVRAGVKPAERPTTNKAEFVKAAERPTIDKDETAKKPAVRYAEMYKRTSKRSTVRG